MMSFQFSNNAWIHKPNKSAYKEIVKLIQIMEKSKMSEVRQSGMVRSLNIPTKTFGFISTPEGDRFFHWSEFKNDSDKPFHHLRMGDSVTFTPATSNEGKPIAKDVHFKYAVDTRGQKKKS